MLEPSAGPKHAGPCQRPPAPGVSAPTNEYPCPRKASASCRRQASAGGPPTRAATAGRDWASRAPGAGRSTPTAKRSGHRRKPPIRPSRCSRSRISPSGRRPRPARAWPLRPQAVSSLGLRHRLRRRREGDEDPPAPAPGPARPTGFGLWPTRRGFRRSRAAGRPPKPGTTKASAAVNFPGYR
jgi:hypothetical protein